MISDHERFVRKHLQALNPRLPLEYRVLHPGKHPVPVRAWTDYRKAVVKIDESYAPEEDPLKNPKESSQLEKFCGFVIGHECAGHNNSNHSIGCPGTVERHAVQRHVVHQVMKKVGKKGVKYMTNAAQDVLANTIVAAIDGYDTAGATEFYRLNIQHGSDEFFEAFVKLQLACWGRAGNILELHPYLTQRESVNEAWKGAVKDLGLRVGRPYHNRKILLDESKWEKTIEVITKHLAPLLSEQTSQPICTHGIEPREGDIGDGDPDEAGEEYESPFDEELDEPGAERRIARKFFEEKRGKPSFMNRLEALLRLYESLGTMPVEVAVQTEECNVPLIPYQWAPTEDLSRASFTKFGMSANGNLEFVEPTERLELPYQYSKPKQDKPKLCIAICDRSPSMKDQLDQGKNDTSYIPWGDKSKWHYLLWAVFATQNDTITWGHGDSIDNDAVLYATASRQHGRVRPNNLDQLRRWLLENPPGNLETTLLDMNTIRNICSGEQRLLITVSDGDIGNWDDVEEEFIKLIKPHAFAHMQIGTPSSMSTALEEAGRRVYPVLKGQDMIQYMRGISAEVYNA